MIAINNDGVKLDGVLKIPMDTGAQLADRYTKAETDGNDITKDADYIAVSRDVIWCDTLTNGAFTITLPESPSDFDWVKFIDYKANFDDDNLTVARNGSTIMDADEDKVLSTENEVITLKAINGDWRIV